MEETIVNPKELTYGQMVRLSLLIYNMVFFEKENFEYIKNLSIHLLELAQRYEWDWVIQLAFSKEDNPVQAHKLIYEEMRKWLVSRLTQENRLEVPPG